MIDVKGKPVDNETRCEHYHSPLDIIAIKFKCCNTYYPCFSCHEETAGHTAQRWQAHELETKAILCGVCKHELSVNAYLQSGYNCPNCNAALNPGCSNHNHLYFDL